ncbi:MAG: hypothetical protein KAY37_13215 [Phycisphaerae bacterium]|nr:hypothetical protein [Phycisphaerae bacterium]
MHRFMCYPKQKRQPPPDLHGAHLVGTDNVPVRAEIRWKNGAIVCMPRTQDPVGLSLLWPVNGFGTVQLQTTRLPVREKPYHLPLELARHQLMRLSVKREEWGLFDYSGLDDLSARIDQARDAFVAALQKIDNPTAATRLANESLAHGLAAGEEMSRFHASVFLSRRRQSGGFSRPYLGVCAAPGVAKSAALVERIAAAFDFVRIPFVWREIQPTEPQHLYGPLDECVKACGVAGLSLRGGPLLNFGVKSVPDWMYLWEDDFEAIYEAAREHVERTVKRQGKMIASWIAVSGLHADNVFGFSFEQVMELTRMAASVTKQTAPRSQVLIDLTQPWGEYYARNQQTVPPLLYADMVVQSGINFDGFGLQFLFGIGSEGYHLRDLLQISSLIDKLANLGKPIHITALGAPSNTPNGSGDGPAPGGEWRAPWSDNVQANWITSLCEIALSKPYVETVCVQPLTDCANNVITNGGLLREDHSPKPVLDRLIEMRQRFLAGSDE